MLIDPVDSRATLPPLSETVLHLATEVLARRDPDSRRVVRRLGPPPMWYRPPGFAALVRIILEQQVSLASARAAFDRLAEALPAIEPVAFLSLDDATLNTIGFSRQKSLSCRALAQTVLDGTLDLDSLDELPDDAVREQLTGIPGIGPWTADVYLLTALRRPDVWPVDDLTFRAAVQDVRGLPSTPTFREFRHFGEPWRPWRSVAARLLWHHYLNRE